MSTHTTNYFDSFIEVSPDCGAQMGTAPTREGTIAAMQYARLMAAPYQLTSDELLFGIFAERQDIDEDHKEAAQQAFFSKGQPCLRASPLVKNFGWGVHFDQAGRIALYGVESAEYANFLSADNVAKFKGMRSKR